MKETSSRLLVHNIQSGPIMKEASGSLPAHTVRSRPIKRAILWGTISLAAYLLIFLNQEMITQYFTRGGFMAAVIVLTAVIFSVVHGTFAHFVLDILGIEALVNHERTDH